MRFWAKIKAHAKACWKKIKYGGYSVLIQTHRCKKHAPPLWVFLDILVFFAGALLIWVSPLLYSVVSGLLPMLLVIWVVVSAWHIFREKEYRK